jgi:hypothetical protein
MASGMLTSWPYPPPETRCRMLHVQDGHAMEPHCCHRLLAANDETDQPELKLATFVCETEARWG